MNKFLAFFIHLVTLSTSLKAGDSTVVIFQSKTELEKALNPLKLEEVSDRIANSSASDRLQLSFNEALIPQPILLRNQGVGNLFKTELYRTETLTVFYPENPRVPQHLVISLNRKGIGGITDVNEQENKELFSTIQKIAEIYKTVAIRGFVIAQYDVPQQGHQGCYAVEIIPHLPGFGSIKNIVDKVDCNRYVLFRTANLSPIAYEIAPHEISEQAMYWKTAFESEPEPLTQNDIKIEFPYSRIESHRLESAQILHHQLLELLADKGGVVLDTRPFLPLIPTKIPEITYSITSGKCAFCDDSVIQRQLVYEYEDVVVLYNIRKSPKAGSCFLVLPKRHIEKVYGLTPSEIHNIWIVRKALTQLLKETHPESQVIVYTQDDPAVGQTVFHSHEQVVAVDPETVALTWTFMSLYPNGNVSDEEMLSVQEEFRTKLKQKIKEFSELAKTG